MSSLTSVAPSPGTARNWPGVLLRLAMALGVLVAIWLPHYARFHIDRSPVGSSTTAASLQQPAATVLDEIAGMRFAIRLDLPAEQLLATADAAIAGTLRLPLLDHAVALQGFPADLRIGSSTAQLILAGLGLERLFLDAYDASHDPRYRQQALKRVLDFAAYDASQRTSADFLWNDHAVAARISVLAHLWRMIRDDPTISAADKGTILSLVQRSGRLLAHPEQFTVRTNHGVMQNLALMQIGAAFPALPEAAAWRQLGLARLQLQAGFYVSPEGFVLEHSGEYHAFGAELLAQAVRLCVLNGMEPPDWLVRDAQLSASRLTQLIRPDGSLPLIGNTSAGNRATIPDVSNAGHSPLRESPPSRPTVIVPPQLLPISGYALWWNQDSREDLLSQTVINWAKHDGHGHKHADEGAVQLWADGIDWLTSTGYWPYDAPNMADAYGWPSSNAPHRLGEGRLEKREIELLGHISDSHFQALDLQRRNPGGERFRRQIIQLDAATLLVLDFTTGSGAGSETIWTVSHRLTMEPGTTAGQFVAQAPGLPRHLGISLDSPTTTTTTLMRGSRTPFAGWVVNNNHPVASYALRVLIPAANSVSGALFALTPSSDAARQVQLHLAAGATPEKWQASISTGNTTTQLSRAAGQLTIDSSRDGAQRYAWAAAPDIRSASAALKAAYAKAVEQYPPSRDLSPFRLKLSYLVAALALCIELVWWRITRQRPAPRRGAVLATIGLAALWGGFTSWAIGIYLH